MKKMITEKQKDLIVKLLEDRIVDEPTVFHTECWERQFRHIKVDLHKPINEFTCYEASVYINMLLTECESKKAIENMRRGLEKYEKLFAYAKEKKLKGLRDRMRKATIIEKCKKQGIEIPNELLWGEWLKWKEN